MLVLWVQFNSTNFLFKFHAQSVVRGEHAAYNITMKIILKNIYYIQIHHKTLNIINVGLCFPFSLMCACWTDFIINEFHLIQFFQQQKNLSTYILYKFIFAHIISFNFTRNHIYVIFPAYGSEFMWKCGPPIEHTMVAIRNQTR